MTVKTLGGAAFATAQGTIMLALAPLIGVRLTAFGVFVASRIQRMEGFSVVMQLLLFPMLFLSGALFPLKGPARLARGQHPPQPRSPTPSTRCATWSSICSTCPRPSRSGSPPASPCTLPTAIELAITCVFAVVFLALAVNGFGKPE